MFAISTHGRVQNLLSGEIMVEHTDYDGSESEYLGVNLIDRNGNEFCAPIEALVVEAFLGPIDGLERIIHKNGDPWDNHDWNLEVDASYWRCKADDCE